jgi:hypothetical protein
MTMSPVMERFSVRTVSRTEFKETDEETLTNRMMRCAGPVDGHVIVPSGSWVLLPPEILEL